MPVEYKEQRRLADKWFEKHHAMQERMPLTAVLEVFAGVYAGESIIMELGSGDTVAIFSPNGEHLHVDLLYSEKPNFCRSNRDLLETHIMSYGYTHVTAMAASEGMKRMLRIVGFKPHQTEGYYILELDHGNI